MSGFSPKLKMIRNRFLERLKMALKIKEEKKAAKKISVYRLHTS
jgi:hypothetical protein